MLSGIPQQINVRGLLLSGSAATECDWAYVNGQDKAAVPPFNAANTTQTITAGPTTTGPVFTCVNGVVAMLPFGQSIAVPKAFLDALDTTQWTHA